MCHFICIGETTDHVSIRRSLCPHPLPSSPVSLHQYPSFLVECPKILQVTVQRSGHSLWRGGHESSCEHGSGLQWRIHRKGLDRAVRQPHKLEVVIHKQQLLPGLRDELQTVGLRPTRQLVWGPDVCEDVEPREMGRLKLLPEELLHLLQWSQCKATDKSTDRYWGVLLF